MEEGGRHMERKLLGRHIVIDPEICHGKPTFVGTRIFVADVLDEVARGMTWYEITKLWGGHVSSEAIAEALSLARQAFLDHAGEHTLESLTA
jgi:uncharacterized protein (DUF433 family)